MTIEEARASIKKTIEDYTEADGDTGALCVLHDGTRLTVTGFGAAKRTLPIIAQGLGWYITDIAEPGQDPMKLAEAFCEALKHCTRDQLRKRTGRTN